MKEKIPDILTSPSAEIIKIYAKELEEIIYARINVNDDFEWKVVLERKTDNDTADTIIEYKPSKWTLIEYSLDKLVEDGLLMKIEIGKYRRIK